MLSRKRGAPKLSKALLDLKFMKRTKMKTEIEEEREKSLKLLESSITEGMRSGREKFWIENSYAQMEKLMSGRLSFGGMNPEIERLMEEEEKSREDYGKMPADVSDEQMTALSLTISKKFKKHKHNTFQAPDSDSD